MDSLDVAFNYDVVTGTQHVHDIFTIGAVAATAEDGNRTHMSYNDVRDSSWQLTDGVAALAD